MTRIYSSSSIPFQFYSFFFFIVASLIVVFPPKKAEQKSNDKTKEKTACNKWRTLNRKNICMYNVYIFRSKQAMAMAMRRGTTMEWNECHDVFVSVSHMSFRHFIIKYLWPGSHVLGNRLANFVSVWGPGEAKNKRRRGNKTIKKFDSINFECIQCLRWRCALVRPWRRQHFQRSITQSIVICISWLIFNSDRKHSINWKHRIRCTSSFVHIFGCSGSAASAPTQNPVGINLMIWLLCAKCKCRTLSPQSRSNAKHKITE